MKWSKLVGKTITGAEFEDNGQVLTITLNGEEELRITPKMELGQGEFYSPALSVEESVVADIPL